MQFLLLKIFGISAYLCIYVFFT